MKNGSVKIFTSKQLGLTGDNGEQYCIFYHDHVNPLNSAWQWVFTIEEANHALAINRGIK